jgi:predicted permease
MRPEHWLYTIPLRLRSFFRRRDVDRELEDELSYHLEQKAGEYAAKGMNPQEARRAALLEMGGVEKRKEECRDARRVNWLRDFLQDLRYGLRMLRKNPSFTAMAVLTLALGIGANSTIFSWINSTLLNPIPGLAHAGDFSAVFAGAVSKPNSFSYLDYADLRDRNQCFSGFLAYSLGSMNLTGEGKPERVWGMLASVNYFDVLGVHPILGRGFLPSEDVKAGGAPVVVISYRLWQTRYGGNPSLIGQTIAINRHPFTVIGVAPSVFQGTQTGLRSELWVPLAMQPQVTPFPNALNDRGAKWLFGLGRQTPGVTREQAQAQMSLLYKQLADQFPLSHKGETGITLHPLWRAPFTSNYYLHTVLLLLMVIAGVVLLLACSIGRRREIAIRRSLGATRGRLVRQLLVESLIFASCGGAIAMLFTLWTAGTLSNFIPPSSVPVSMNIHVDRTVLLATLLISLVTGVVFGVLPAVRSSSVQPVSVLKEEAANVAGGRHKARLSSVLAAAQIALSLLLLVCAGLFIRSFQNAQQFNPGFNPHHVMIASYDLSGSGYSPAQGTEFNRQLQAKLQSLPGVQSVTLATWTPFGFYTSSAEVQAEGYVPRPHESLDTEDAFVGPDYFKTMEIPLVAGRDFGPQDGEKSQPVAIVNQKFADEYWPQQDAVGRRILVYGAGRTVIGVARTTDYDAIGEKPRAFVYFPILQSYYPGVILHVRVAGDPLAFVATAEKAVHELDADLAVFDVATLDWRINLNTTNRRLAGAFVGGFGILALILASVGVYGVLAYTTRQRTHEIGVRMALGGEPRDVFALVLRQGAKLVFAGVARPRRILRFDSRLVGRAFRRDGHGPVDVCRRSLSAHDCRPRRVLHPRASRHARRSHGGVTLRIGRIELCGQNAGFTRFHCGCVPSSAALKWTASSMRSCTITSSKKPRNTPPAV